MQPLRSLPTREFCRLVDCALAVHRNGPTLGEPIKRRLRGLAKAADDIERGRLRGVVWVAGDVAEWLTAAHQVQPQSLEAAVPLVQQLPAELTFAAERAENQEGQGNDP